VFEGVWTEGKLGSNVTNLTEHFKNHGSQFATANKTEYYNQTKQFITEAINGGFKTKIEPKTGFDILRTYEPNSNTFSVFEVSQSTNAITPRTLFKPDKGLEYFEKQTGELIDIFSFFNN
jgi:pyocin large subunit-like protein